jgi:hypothetical protein
MDQMPHQPSVAIIIPTLNKRENIDELLSAVLRQATNGVSLEIMVADGGSADGTRERMRIWEGKAPVQLTSADGARGLAVDVLDATRHARADIVVGNRYVPGGATPGWPRRRSNLSRLGGIMTWPLTDLRDPMSGFFAVRKESLAADPQSGKSVAEIERSVVQSTGKDALLIGMDRYFIASEMAFYVRQNQDSACNSAGRGAVGGDSPRCDYRFQPGDTLGRTAIVVALKKDDLQQDSFLQWFSELTEIKEQRVTKEGVPVGSFFQRVGYGLRNCLWSKAGELRSC